MKKLLANLAGVAAGLLFGLAAAYAIDGGPWGGGGGTVNTVGTYAGVLIPVSSPGPSVSPSPSATPSATPTPINSLALFTLQVPSTGIAHGNVLIFREGFVYTDDPAIDGGGIQGLADPNSGSLHAILSGRFDEVIFGSLSSNETHHYYANGSFTRARIKGTSTGGGTAIRGKATLTYRRGDTAGNPAGDAGPIDYKIRAFKQSDQAQ